MFAIAAGIAIIMAASLATIVALTDFSRGGSAKRLSFAVLAVVGMAVASVALLVSS